MTRYAFILLFTFFISCSPNKLSQHFTIPSDKDINGVIEAIIYQTRLPVLKFTNLVDTIYNENGLRKIVQSKSVPLCVDLEKYNITRLKTDSIINDPSIPPPPPNSLALENLLSLEVDGKTFFAPSDSSYFRFLDSHIKAYAVSKDLSAQIWTITRLENLIETKLTEASPYYALSIPIFSKDNQKAYVIVNFACRLCGYGTEVYLKKVNGHWKVVKAQQLWIS